MPWLRLHPLRRYEAGVARVLRTAQPALIEVHNRPDMALYLARKFPTIPVCLFLHNDPRGMRHARTPFGTRNRHAIDHGIDDTTAASDHRRHFHSRNVFSLPAERVAQAVDEIIVARLVLAHRPAWL